MSKKKKRQQYAYHITDLAKWLILIVPTSVFYVFTVVEALTISPEAVSSWGAFFLALHIMRAVSVVTCNIALLLIGEIFDYDGEYKFRKEISVLGQERFYWALTVMYQIFAAEYWSWWITKALLSDMGWDRLITKQEITLPKNKNDETLETYHHLAKDWEMDEDDINEIGDRYDYQRTS